MQRMKATGLLEDVSIKQRLERQGFKVERMSGGGVRVRITKDGVQVHETPYASWETGLEIAEEAERNDPSI